MSYLRSFLTALVLIFLAALVASLHTQIALAKGGTSNALTGLPAENTHSSAVLAADARGTTTVPASKWVHYNPAGELVYKALDPQGDKIMDFSTAGYEQGALPIRRRLSKPPFPHPEETIRPTFRLPSQRSPRWL